MTHAYQCIVSVYQYNTKIKNCQYDFQKILSGVNLLAVADNGERVVTNLFAALEPVLVEGAKRCASQQAEAIRAKGRVDA